MEIKTLLEFLFEDSVKDEPFDFGDTVDKLASQYMLACRGKFPEWDGPNTTSYKILATSPSSKVNLSENVMKFNKEVESKSYLKQVLSEAIKLGIEQRMRKDFKNQNHLRDIIKTKNGQKIEG